MDRMILFLVGTSSAWILAAQPVLAAQGWSAVATYRVHPVLVGRPDCEVAQLVITAEPASSAVLQSISVSLEGTTDLADLESIRIWDTGSKTELKPTRLFGEPASAAAALRFTGERPLEPGPNVFSITCRLSDSARLDHRVRVACTAVETSAGRQTPRPEGTGVSRRIGVALRQAGQDGVHTYRIPALGTTAQGTLLAVYDIRRRGSRDLQADIDVGLSRSTDGGQTWEPMRVIMDLGEYGGLPEAENGVGDPGLVIDQQTGEIFVFALWVHGKPGTHQWRGNGSEPGYEIGKTGQFMLVRSIDDGKTWSPLENLTRQVKQPSWILLAPSPQQGIQLADGTLVMPVQGRDDDGPFAALMLSRDHGRSWSVSPRAYSGGNECQAAQLGDGSILLNIRNGDRKRRAVVITADQGETWRPHATHERDLIEPTCNGSLVRWVDRRPGGADPLLLFANPRSEKLRVDYTIQASLDDGQTWPAEHRLLLDEGRGFGYPSLSPVDDEHLGIVYEGSQAHLVFERIAREELLAGPARPE